MLNRITSTCDHRAANGDKMSSKSSLRAHLRNFKRSGLVKSATVRTGLTLTLVASMSASLVLGTAIAQNNTPNAPLRLKSDFLGYNFSVSPRVTYSDNINLVPDEFSDGQFILSNLFTGNAIVSLPRFTALFSGDLDFSYFVGSDEDDAVFGAGADDSDFFVNQSVSGTGTATIVDNFLYFDISGGSSRQLVGDNAAFSNNVNAARGNQTTVSSFAVSPYIYRSLPNESVAEVRYRYSQSFIDEQTGGVFLNDSRSHEALVRYESGSLFERLNFVASAYGNLTDEDGQVQLGVDGLPLVDADNNPLLSPDFAFDQGSLEFEGQYAINDKFSLSGAIGYDEIETVVPGGFFDDGELSGIFWRAGFALRPGRRSSLRVEYGRRFDDDFIEADARYQISRRFVFTAGANRTFQTRALSNADQIALVARSTLDFADQLREGGFGTPRDIIQLSTQLGNTGGTTGFGAQTIGVGPTNNAFFNLNGSFDRTTVSLGTSYQNADFGFREFENVTSQIAITRTLSRKVSLFGNVNYRFADTSFSIADCVAAPGAFGLFSAAPGFDATAACSAEAVNAGITHTVIGTLGANYQFTNRLRGFASYSRAERFSPIELFEYSENSGTVGVVLDF